MVVNGVEVMIARGVARGRVIELDEPLGMADGTRVNVEVTQESKPRIGSPQALLQLAGTLTEEEGLALEAFVNKQRQADLDWEKMRG